MENGKMNDQPNHKNTEPEYIENVSNETDSDPELPLFTCSSCGKDFFYYDFVSAVVEYGLIFLDGPQKFVLGFTCRFCDEPSTVLKEFTKTAFIPQPIADLLGCIYHNQPWHYSLFFENSSGQEFHGTGTGRWAYNSFPYEFEAVQELSILTHMREIEPKVNIVSDFIDPGEFYFNEFDSLNCLPAQDTTTCQPEESEGPSSDEAKAQFQETVYNSFCSYSRGSQILGPALKILWFTENAVNDIIRLNVEALKQKKVFPRYYLFDPTWATINHFSWKHKLKINHMDKINIADIPISGMFSDSSKKGISKAFEFLTILDQPYPNFLEMSFSDNTGVYPSTSPTSIAPSMLEDKSIYHEEGKHRRITEEIWDHFHKDYIQEALVFNADRFIDEFCEAASGISFTYKTAWDLKEKHLLDLQASIKSKSHRSKKKVERDEIINQKAMEAEKTFPEVKIISQARSINELKIRISKYKKVIEMTNFKGPIMLLGERGTGKTHFARAIHHALRLKGDFIPIDCGAISEKLFESELFGHKKGAFTGAENDKKGAFENAAGGSLFLDEIGNLSLNHQQKLLGVLQDVDGFWQYQVVGSSTIKRSDAFVIVATNTDLETFIKEGKFRADLYDRLNKEKITIPPLRDRKCDVPIFFKNLAKTIPVSAELENDLLRLNYDWPDNIRGLIHIIDKIEREKIMKDDTSPICFDDLPQSITQHHKKPKHKSVKDAAVKKQPGNTKVSSDQVKQAMENNNGNKTKAAAELGITYHTVLRHCRKLGI